MKSLYVGVSAFALAAIFAVSIALVSCGKGEIEELDSEFMQVLEIDASQETYKFIKDCYGSNPTRPDCPSNEPEPPPPPPPSSNSGSGDVPSSASGPGDVPSSASGTPSSTSTGGQSSSGAGSVSSSSAGGQSSSSVQQSSSSTPPSSSSARSSSSSTPQSSSSSTPPPAQSSSSTGGQPPQSGSVSMDDGEVKTLSGTVTMTCSTQVGVVCWVEPQPSADVSIGCLTINSWATPTNGAYQQFCNKAGGGDSGSCQIPTDKGTVKCKKQ